jgi:hypothetical protein
LDKQRLGVYFLDILASCNIIPKIPPKAFTGTTTGSETIISNLTSAMQDLLLTLMRQVSAISTVNGHYIYPKVTVERIQEIVILTVYSEAPEGTPDEFIDFYNAVSKSHRDSFVACLEKKDAATSIGPSAFVSCIIVPAERPAQARFI